MTKNLEENVQETTKRRGKGWKGFLIGLATGAVVGTGLGMKHELRHNTLYKRGAKHEIKEAALQGYAWKEGADPTFYAYEQPLLIRNEKEMTMQGHLIKLTEQDTIDAGPINKDGSVGYPVYIDLKHEVQEDVQTLNDKLKRLGEHIKEGYHKTDSAITDQLKRWFKKDTATSDTTYAR
ncbi:hypothetical protein GF367_02570 [Candidatus Woesearchaeota archaeon]|nr:hypothetical protein [Candidatus Woesearchaeota archaeon]